MCERGSSRYIVHVRVVGGCPGCLSVHRGFKTVRVTVRVGELVLGRL